MMPNDLQKEALKQTVRLFFNPLAGASRKDRADLERLIRILQALEYAVEPWVMSQGCDTGSTIRQSLAEGYRLFAVCGGDGTVAPVAAALAGTDGTLAILPAGTRNNIARSAGIPDDLVEAAALIRDGRRALVDMGAARCGDTTTPFLEICSVGLASALTPPGDMARHGDLGGVKDFLWTLFSAEPADISVTIDGSESLRHRGHAVVVTNMPYTGLSYQLGPEGCQRDGLLNVTHFADLSKLDLLRYISTGVHPGKREDPRIHHCLAETVDISTEPPMPVMVDGVVVGQSPVHVSVIRRSLAMLVPRC